jgi:hypothetical protein
MAQEGTSTKSYDFMYGKFLLKSLFGIEIDEGDYIEMAYGIYRDIGNVNLSVYKVGFTVDDTYTVQLPCNVESIEAVTDGVKDTYDNAFNWDNGYTAGSNYRLPDILGGGRVLNRLTVNSRETTLHPSGSFIPYDIEGTIGNNSLRFSEELLGTSGEIIYRGMVVDNDGNPLLNRKEADAIAYKMAFYDTQKKVFMNEQGAASKLDYISRESGRKMAAAKIPERMSQNELDKLLTARTSHDRKVYWSSYKPLQ